MVAKQTMKENLQCTSKYGHLRISQDICHVRMTDIEGFLTIYGHSDNLLNNNIGCNVPLVKTASMFVRNLIQLLHNFNGICASCSLKMQVLFALKSERFLFQMKNLKILIWCFICVPRFIPLTQIDINYWLI